METALAITNGHIVPLTVEERQKLEGYEAQVEGGLEALYRIKEEGLWREYGSFENYVATRWDEKTARRRNQLLSGLRTHETLTKILGTSVPINNTEYALRPLVTLAQENPEKAAEVYKIAVQIANGETPSHSEIKEAKNQLTEKDILKQQAIDAINALRFYNDYVVEIKNGADPQKILALVTTYESCEIRVRRVMMKLDVRDISFIRMLNDHFRRGSEVVQEALETGYLQFREEGIALKNATARDLRRALDEAYQEHLREKREQNRGQAVSVVVFNGDPIGTLESLRQVLDYATLIGLQNLLSLA